MKHKSRIDWCVLGSIALAIVSLFSRASVWIAGPVLVILLLCAFPQSYETAPEGLVVRDALTRRVIPYEAISHVGPNTGSALWAGRVRIEYGLASDLLIAPADQDAFLADLASRTPHLTWIGRRLVLRDRHVEWFLTPPRSAQC